MTVTRNQINQGGILKMVGSNAPGVCLEACRRWVKAALNGTLKAGETVYDIVDGKSIRALLAAHQKRNNKSETGIEGMSLTTTHRTGGGTFKKFKGLRTREDVINHILSVPGVYIYVVDAPMGAGHAFSFDSRDRSSILFFDPNLGEWQFDGESDGEMRTFWHDFWKGSLPCFANKKSYKDAYHKGDRQLWMYKVADAI